jgi:hypothetical protein
MFVSRERRRKDCDGGKDGGMINFPSFGTTTKSKGRKDGAGSHINIVSSQIWTESRRDMYFFVKRQKNH